MGRHQFKIKKGYMLLILLLIVTMLVGCTATQSSDSEATQSSDSTDEMTEIDQEILEREAKNDIKPTSGRVESRNPKTVNWDSDKSIVQTAIDNQTVIVQFMSGEGCYVVGTSGDNFRWGDAALVAFPNGETMLIDGAMQDYGEMLVKNLRKLGVEKLDYCMMSHMHGDHYAGFFSDGGVFENFEVGTFFWSGIYPKAYSSTLKPRVEKLVTDAGTKLVTLAQGDVYMFGDVKMTVLSPEPGRVGETSYSDTDESENADSVAVRLDYGEWSYLTAGDFYISEELEFLDRVDASLLEVDVVKMNHHGRSTSNGDAWCEAVKAKIAVATSSVEVDNVTYRSYAKVGTVSYIDTYDGYVRVEAKNNGSFTVETSREREHANFDAMDKMYKIERKEQY